MSHGPESLPFRTKNMFFFLQCKMSSRSAHELPERPHTISCSATSLPTDIARCRRSTKQNSGSARSPCAQKIFLWHTDAHCNWRLRSVQLGNLLLASSKHQKQLSGNSQVAVQHDFWLSFPNNRIRLSSVYFQHFSACVVHYFWNMALLRMCLEQKSSVFVNASISLDTQRAQATGLG